MNVIAFDTRERYEHWAKVQTASPDGPVVFLSAPLPGLTEEDRRRFLTAYVDVVGQISRHDHSLMWWATDISSKNRFFSPLIPYLEKFFKLMRAIERSPGNVLIAVGVPWEINDSVQRALTARGIAYSWHGRAANPAVAAVKEFLLRLGRIGRHVCYILPRMAVARRSCFSSLIGAMADSREVYAVKTFASARSFDAQGMYKDLFFGGLPDFLSQQRRTIILADVMDDFAQTCALLCQKGQGRMYPWEAFLTLPDVAQASVRMAAYNIQVPDQLMFEGQDIAQALRNICLVHGSKIQPLHFYQYFMMKRFLKCFKVKELALTCEFNPWEKMCLMAVKENSPSTRTFGYQHTVVPQASANMFTSRFEEGIVPRPDVVVTVGEKPKAIIHRYETCAPSPVKTGCGLRFAYLSAQGQSPRSAGGRILLALEGLPQVVGMTDYVLNELAGDDRYRLRIRTHPVLPLEKFVRGLTVDPRRTPGMEVSSGTSLQEDIAWADIVVYWGSTVALEALGMGKPVVHYDDGSLLSYDPLFELEDFKWRVQAPQRLAPVLEEIALLPDGEYASRLRAARQYIAEYFHPVTPAAMNIFLEG